MISLLKNQLTEQIVHLNLSTCQLISVQLWQTGNYNSLDSSEDLFFHFCIFITWDS